MTQIEDYIHIINRTRLMGGRPEGWVYANTEELLVARGRLYRPVPRPANVRRGAPNDCFRSATDVATDRDGYVYVEGYARSGTGLVPVHHAWVTADGETAVDPTWEDGFEYFGVAFDIDWLWAFLGEAGFFGVLDTIRVDLLAELLRTGFQDALVALPTPARPFRSRTW